ncbi:MAG: phospholipase D-like domain-containing protein [Planctomycetota bacterium]
MKFRIHRTPHASLVALYLVSTVVSTSAVTPSVARADSESQAVGLDAVTTPGQPVALRAKLTASGLLKKSLKDEVIHVEAFGETHWTRTDKTGFAAVTVTPKQSGVSEFRATLARDSATTATGRLFVIDPSKEVVVVDIDKTISDMGEWRVPFQGAAAAAFPGASDVLQDLSRTKQILYLTARDDRYDRETRAFLSRNGFPDGPVIYNDIGFASAEERAQFLPGNHGKYKLQQLEALKARGVKVSLGIGNTKTDAFAYEGAGLKSFLLNDSPLGEKSFVFPDYAGLRRQLEKEGILPASPRVTSEGTWKFSFTQDGVRHDGMLDAVVNGTEFEATATEVDGDTWVARGAISGRTFTVRRALVNGVVGSLNGLRRSGEVEYVATLNESDVAPLAVFRVLGSQRTRIGGGELTRPPYFNERRRQIDKAIQDGDDQIIALSDEVLASATPAEKVAMLQVLTSFGDSAVTFGARNLNPIPVKKSRQKAIVKILESAKDATEFDRIFYRVNDGRLLRAVTGDEDDKVRALIAKHHSSAQPGDWAGYLKYLDGVTGSTSSGRNKVDFLVDGEQVVPAVVAAIDAAKESIHLSVYQWQADELGFKFARKLADKAKAGVKVRVLLDENGTGDDDKWKDLVKFLRQNGVECVVNPTSFMKNHLDHRKILVVDGKVGFTGGMNIGLHYQKEWHDQQTRLEGPVVAKLQDAFLERWTAEAGTPPLPTERLYPPLPEVESGPEMRIVSHDGAGKDRNIKAAYLRAIETSTTSVKIATPYFSDQDMVDALCKAAKRGVKVQLVLPKENDVSIMEATARAYYKQLLASGVEVHEYKDRMAHEKVAVIDGVWATGGSSNLDARSLEFNDELNYVIVDPTFAKTVEKDLFEKDLAKSERITSAKSGPKAWLLRFASPWL